MKPATFAAPAVDRQFAFTDSDFRRVRAMIHARAGISLSDQKREMVYSRLARRLRAVQLESFSVYLDQLDAAPDAAEWEAFVNALTTNLTAFFREPHHFPLLAEHAAGLNRAMQVWCAAASTGEEAYSIAITLLEALGAAGPASRVLATDIDTQVIEHGRRGVYSYDRVARIEPERLRRFFLKGRGAQAGRVRVRPEPAALVEFRQLNLLDEHWGIPTSFDVVFCRNVMIYFDKPTQARVLERIARHMAPGGLLFAGHSENFTYVTQAFRLRGHTVYERVQG